MKAFWRDQSGATAIEYGLLIALLCLVVIVGMSLFSKAASDMYDYIGTKFTAATNAP